jgi:pullulanase
MSIDDGTNAPSDLDTNYDAIVVIFNYTDASQDVVIDGAAGFTQHIAQSETTGVAFDAGSSTFTVPALSTVVFVADQGPSQGTGIPAGDVAPFVNVSMRGSFTSWVDQAMFYEGEGVYKLSYLSNAAVVDGQFGIDTDGSFNNHDQNVDFSGSTVVVTGDTGNALVSLEIDTRYEMTFNVNENSFTIEEEANALFDVVAIRSEFIDAWGTDLAFDYLGLNRYEIKLFVPAADVTDGEFGIVTDGGWNAHDQGVDFSQSGIEIGGSAGNGLVSLTGGQEYDLFYNATDKVFTIDDHEALYASVQINASFIGWTATDMTYTSADTWTVTLAIATDVVAGEFGILTDGNWNAHDQGVDFSGSAITVSGVSGNGLIDLTGGESYTFTYDGINHSANIELVIP